ncbi:MAG: DUF1298 domain-containing protein [Streptosporangiales bacterium]|nr:DUF1298 domain-containing protein [Streptosporangiales bacterium]
MRALIDRATSADLMQLAGDSTSHPRNIAAILVLDTTPLQAWPLIRHMVTGRARSVPRLRQCLVSTPWGCGRPIWVDDPEFDIEHHLRRQVTCPAPGDEHALLRLAADAMAAPLDRRHPLWSLTMVTGLADGRAALIGVTHHVMTDGTGGMGVLEALLDGGTVVPVARSASRPTNFELFVDTLRTRCRRVWHLPAQVRDVRDGLRELVADGVATTAPTSLRRPCGSERALAVVRAELAAVRAAAHRYGGTVNDVLLAAVGGALGDLLRSRGESTDAVLVSVPVSGRRPQVDSRPTNKVGVITVPIPTGGQPARRLASVTRTTRSHRTTRPGASVALLGPVFRALDRLGLFDWFVRRQRFIDTSVTNLHGPVGSLSFLGVRVDEVVAVSTLTGNVTVNFAVLSYAGRLTMTVVADEATCPDLDVLAAALQRELDVLAGGDARATSLVGVAASGNSV